MKKELWKRLKRYRFQNLAAPSLGDRIASAFGGPDPFTRAFAAKIAKKREWDPEFAYLAIREYKKFIFLGVISPYEITPPKIIDHVWHEHLHFSRGYREFCQDVLHQFFDHNPELIPFDEQTDIFNAQYQKTLELYEREFGMKPPPEIWGWSKFNPKSVTDKAAKPRRKETDSGYTDPGDSTPLYLMFTSSEDSGYAPVPVQFEGGGGSMAGGGASGEWAAPASIAPASVDTGTTASCSTASSCGGGGCGGD